MRGSGPTVTAPAGPTASALPAPTRACHPPPPPLLLRSYALGAAAVFAMSMSTIISLVFGKVVQSPNPNDGLANSKYAVVAVGVYCVLWFFVQDIGEAPRPGSV
jgi:hypothetical protein